KSEAHSAKPADASGGAGRPSLRTAIAGIGGMSFAFPPCFSDKPPEEKSMPTLHPQIVNALEIMRKIGMQPIESMSPADARRQMEETAKSRKAEPLPVDRVAEREIPGPPGSIRLRLYWPEAGGTVPSIA